MSPPTTRRSKRIYKKNCTGAIFFTWVALRSDPALPDLNVREQWDICGHMSTDIPIVPDRVGACRLRRLDGLKRFIKKIAPV